MDDQNFNDSKVAAEWIQVVESDNAKIRENDIYAYLKKWTTDHSMSDILDVGAGQGVCSNYIDLNNRNYVGLEASPFLVQRAQELYPEQNKKFVLGNIYQMPFQDGTFDAAFSVSVWHLLKNLPQASTELSRVLKDGGHFQIITANPNSYSHWTSHYSETSLDGRRFEGKIHKDGIVFSQDVLYLNTMDEISIALHESGLKVNHIETFRPIADGQFKYICIQGKKSH